MVGGKAVTVASTDSLNALRDKINALNVGTTPSHVSASILYTAGSNGRLVLTSDVGGASGVDLRDVRTTASDPSVLTQLGLIDGTTSNIGTDGAVRSATFASSAQKVAAMALGVSVYPAPATININGRTISIDLQNQSLADIAAMINAQTPNAASVETVATDSGVSVSSQDLRRSHGDSRPGLTAHARSARADARNDRRRQTAGLDVECAPGRRRRYSDRIESSRRAQARGRNRRDIGRHVHHRRHEAGRRHACVADRKRWTEPRRSTTCSRASRRRSARAATP